MAEIKVVGKFLAVCIGIMVAVYWLRQLGLINPGVWGPK
jgi:hypothetical protein